MNAVQYAEIEEYVIDHYLLYGFYPADAELEDGEIVTFDDYASFLPPYEPRR